MKKRILCLLMCLMMLTGFSAHAGSQDLILITEPVYTPLYASYDPDDSRIIAYIPEGEIALCLAAVDWGYCVAFGNYVGYITEGSGVFVDSRYYDWTLPYGRDYLYETPCGPDNGDSFEDGFIPGSPVPEFPYYPIYAETNQKLATRSGPNTKYTEPGGFREEIVDVYYQTSGNGVQWGCVEFESDGYKYRVYTGMKRIDTYVDVPHDDESYVWCFISEDHEPRLGPGYDYAPAEVDVPANTVVRGYYQQNGWLMFEYDIPGGDVLRAWAPASCWEY